MMFDHKTLRELHRHVTSMSTMLLRVAEMTEGHAVFDDLRKKMRVLYLRNDLLRSLVVEIEREVNGEVDSDDNK